MLKLRSCILLLLLVGTALADLKSDLQSRYGKWDAGYKRQDARTLTGMLAADFRLVSDTGNVTSRKAYVRSLGKGRRPEIYETTVLQVSARKNIAYAWTEEVSRYKGEGVHIHRYKDTWVKRRGTWQLRESRTLSH